MGFFQGERQPDPGHRQERLLQRQGQVQYNKDPEGDPEGPKDESDLSRHRNGISAETVFQISAVKKIVLVLIGIVLSALISMADLGFSIVVSKIALQYLSDIISSMAFFCPSSSIFRP